MRTGVLVRNEVIKARTRPAFWVAFGGFTGLMSLIFGGMFFGSLNDPKQHFTLPAAWGEIIGGPGVLASFFASMMLILLVSAEFSWRTARQNVIDGLSKEEFFAAKLILLPVLTVMFFGTLLLVGGGFGLAGTQAAGASGPIVRDVDAALMGGALVGLVGWCSFAFLLAVTIRSAGPAIGVFFLYFIVEQILGSLLVKLSAVLALVVRFLPMAVFKTLWEGQRYGSSPLRKGQVMPTDTPQMVAAGAAYAVVFVVVAFIVYRRRDL
jgi:hypothetical protein